MAGIAEFYSKNLATEALKGMTQKAKVGGTPGRAPIGPTSRDLWHWLALAGALGLLADWILYGRSDRRMRAAKGVAPGEHWRKAS